MAIHYRIVERPTLKHDKETGKTSHTMARVATQVSKGRVTLEEVAERLEKETSLGKGDVVSVLIHLGEAVSYFCKMGFSVDLKNLGTFTPRISARAEYDPKAKYSSENIKKVVIRYTPDIHIKKEMRYASFEVVDRLPEEDEAVGGKVTLPGEATTEEGSNTGLGE